MFLLLSVFSSVLSVSRELANQLLSSVCDTAIMIMTDSKQEPLSQIQQEWLLLLSHIHEGVVEVSYALYSDANIYMYKFDE